MSDVQSLATIQQLDPIYTDFTQSANQLLALKRAEAASARAEGADARSGRKVRTGRVVETAGSSTTG